MIAISIGLWLFVSVTSVYITESYFDFEIHITTSHFPYKTTKDQIILEKEILQVSLTSFVLYSFPLSNTSKENETEWYTDHVLFRLLDLSLLPIYNKWINFEVLHFFWLKAELWRWRWRLLIWIFYFYLKLSCLSVCLLVFDLSPFYAKKITLLKVQINMPQLKLEKKKTYLMALFCS